MDFPYAVKRAREILNMSQEELARALDVSFVTINRWENGKTRPNKLATTVFFAFCETSGISLNELQGGEK